MVHLKLDREREVRIQEPGKGEMNVKVALASDHAGFELKNVLSRIVDERGHQVVDLGTFDTEPADYPDYAARAGRAVAGGDADRAVLVCGSGVGASIAANKIRGIRAGLCHDTYSARQGVEHDDMNVLVLGSRVVGAELARELVIAFLDASFTGEERHRRRLAKVRQLEKTCCSGPGAEEPGS